MKRVILAALIAGAAIPASAQYYGPPDPYDRPPPPPGYGPPPPAPPGYGYGPQPQPGYGYERPYARRGGSGVCVTSRGNCPIGYVVPINTPCRCEIPGFGPKRGAAL